MQTTNDHDNVYFMTRKQGVSFDRVHGITGCREPAASDRQRVDAMLERLGGRRLAYDSGVAIKPFHVKPADAAAAVLRRD